MEEFQKRPIIRNRQFPMCAKEVLTLVDKVARQPRSPPRAYIRDLQTNIDEYLFCLIECKGIFSTKLSPIQELQLIEMLCAYFDDRKFGSRSTTGNGGSGMSVAFELIFCGQEEEPPLHCARCSILAKTISLASQLRCGPLLGDTAAWMQKTCLSPNPSRGGVIVPNTIPEDIRQVCCCLIKDYCSVGPTYIEDTNFLNTTLHQHRRLQQQRIVSDLSTLAPGLLPYITAAALSKCDWFTAPSLPLLEVLTDWICSDPKLLLKPFRDVSKLQGHSTGTFLRALSEALSKLLALCLVFTSSQPNANRLAMVYGKLELGLLRLMEIAQKFIPLSDKLASTEIPCAVVTSKMVSDTLKRVQQQHQNNVSNTQTVCYAVFRALQSAVVYKCFCGTKRELEQVLASYLTDYPFLQFVLNQTL